MNLNDKTSDLKVYSRSRFFNGMPLTSEDLHQNDDLLYKKLGIILNNTFGSGALETPSFKVNISGNSSMASVQSPFSINLNGDIFLVGNSNSVYPISFSSGFTGTILLVCWMKELTTSSTLYEYGGLCNNTMPNDIMDDELKMLVSTRYQVRWNIVKTTTILDYNDPEIKDIVVNDSFVTEYGEVSSKTFYSTNMSLLGKFYKVPSSTNIPSDDGFVYILPIGSVVSGVVSSVPVPKNLITIASKSEPSTSLPCIWYNINNGNYMIYIEGSWKSLNTDVKYFYGGEYVFDVNYVEETDINITLPFILDKLSKLRVLYNGVEIIENVDFNISYDNNSITLLNYRPYIDDTLKFLYSR